MREVLQDAAADISTLGGDFESYAEFLDLEARAQHVTYFSNSLLPGPLQNWTVAQAITRKYYPELADEPMELLLDTRAERGKYYAKEDTVRSTFFITEAVLDIAPIDAESWDIQLRHLITMASIPHLSLRVIPKDCFTTAENMITLLDLPGGDRVAYFASDIRGDTLCKYTPVIEKVSSTFKDLGAVAVDESASIELVRQRVA